MAKTKTIRFLLVVAVIALLTGAEALADSYARIVRLSDVDGSVEIDRNTGQGFERALMNLPVTQGVRLQTGISGRAEVEFENGSVIRLVGDSSVEFTQLSLRSDGQRVSEIQIEGGIVYVDFRKKGGDDFRVYVGNRAVDLTKDVRFRARVEQGTAEVAVFKGELQVEGDGELAKVKKNETFTLDLNDGARYTLAKGIDTLNTDDYDLERQQYLEQYAGNHGSPYAYGYSDLNRYGSFFDAPGYGLVWQPTSVGFGWDPYSSGYWSYYPGQGYIWVSNYAWGWTPYRYGQWVFLSGRGWCWQPGGWNRWNTGVVVNNPPPTWHRPSPPPTTGHVTVPVGNPTQPHRRVLQTDDFHPHRIDRPDQRGRSPYGQDGRPGRPATATKTTGSPAPANSVAETTTPAAVETQPVSPPRPANDSPIRTTRGGREADTDGNRGHHSETTAPQPSAPARTSAPPPSAPVRSSAPPPSAPSRSMPPPPSAPQRSMSPPPRPSAPPMRPAPSAAPHKRSN